MLPPWTGPDDSGGRRPAGGEGGRGIARRRVALTAPLLVGLLALTALRFAVAAATGLAPDEAYYRVWSTVLQFGYLDHPPMVALLIRAGTALGGETAFGVRLAAPLLALAGSALLAGAARDLLGLDRGRQGRAVLLFNATLLVGVGAVTITPDTPLLFCWGLTLFLLGRALVTGRSRFVAAAGLALGLGFDGKYTAVLLAPAIGVWLVATPATRALLRRPGTFGGVIAGLIAVAPVLGWNAAHGWASFARQGGRTAAVAHPGRGPRFVGELLAGQIGLLTPLVAGLAAVGLVLLVRRVRRGEPGALLVLLSVAVPGLVFLAHAAGGDRVQANWPCVLFPGLALAATLPASRRVAAGAAALGFAITAVVYAQATLRPLSLPARADVTLARLGGWPSFARAVASVDRGPGLLVVAPDYGVAAELAWSRAPIRVAAVDRRWALFRLPRALRAGERVLLVRRLDRAGRPEPADGLAVAPGAATVVVTRGVGQEVAARYAVSVATVPPPPPVAALLPRRPG